MRKAKFSKNDIERVAFYNAYEFFKQSPRLLDTIIQFNFTVMIF